jgi:hypothetical protein
MRQNTDKSQIINENKVESIIAWIMTRRLELQQFDKQRKTKFDEIRKTGKNQASNKCWYYSDICPDTKTAMAL